jgi:serine/threonine protein phosphatase 1
MISFFKHRAGSRKEACGASAPSGTRIYAIGDIHGRLDLLMRLSNRLGEDMTANPCENVTIVLLGDYVDRGPDSAGVIDWIMDGGLPAPYLALRGNHEATLLNFLDDVSVLDEWRRFGGLETLGSYGVDVREPMRGRGYSEAQARFREALPSTHLDFYHDTKLSWSAGDYFFCHAGVKPGVPLALQQEYDLLWIRDEFNLYRGSFEKIVVHGHTPVDAPESLPNRINVDTGAYATDVLTAVALERDDRRFITS